MGRLYVRRWSVITFQSFIFFTTMAAPNKTLNYTEALSKSFIYLESQRSGHLPYNQRSTWRHHSALTDGLQQGVDLVGGYYDAGDNVKFGFPMAFSMTMLSWGVIQYGPQISDAGEYPQALHAIKWGTDYLIKAHTKPTELWVQVGDGETDHGCWQRPEDMTTSRKAYKIDEKNPGSEVAGETAAAMAAASIVFRTKDPNYSHLLLHHAKQLFEFGEKYRGNYDESVKEAKRYYKSISGYKDELLWSAFWLYKATDDPTYLNYALNNALQFGGITWAITEFSWDIKFAGLQIIASMLLSQEKHEEHKHVLNKYKEKAEHYLCACLNKNNVANVRRTNGGMLYTRQWNNLQYVVTATFLLTVYSDYLEATSQLLRCDQGLVGAMEVFAFAKSQADYILGDNPKGMSYMVGYGSRYPQRVHHRGASIVSYREKKSFIGCIDGYHQWFHSKDPNPNVIIGAIVGGPDENDEFNDKRDNFKQTEPCTYTTATFVGVLARLHGMEHWDNSS